jgi:hypothetical protein
MLHGLAAKEVTMTALSSAAWVVHDVGLATSIGGTLFGRAALEPSLDEIGSPIERDRVSADAWQRFSWVNLASHLAFAVPWFIGRRLRTGREVSSTARALTRVKDVLVGISLVSGIGNMFLGRKLGERSRRGAGPENAPAQARPLDRSVGAVGMMNLLANIGVLGVTALLAMEGSKSMRWGASSRWLP